MGHFLVLSVVVLVQKQRRLNVTQENHEWEDDVQISVILVPIDGQISQFSEAQEYQQDIQLLPMSDGHVRLVRLVIMSKLLLSAVQE